MDIKEKQEILVKKYVTDASLIEVSDLLHQIEKSGLHTIFMTSEQIDTMELLERKCRERLDKEDKNAK